MALVRASSPPLPGRVPWTLTSRNQVNGLPASWLPIVFCARGDSDRRLGEGLVLAPPCGITSSVGPRHRALCLRVSRTPSDLGVEVSRCPGPRALHCGPLCKWPPS